MDKLKKTIPEQIAENLPAHYQDGWKQLFLDGVKTQQAVLAEILELGGKSAYAKDHGFAGIGSREEFEALVPVSDYEDYRQYIEDNLLADQGQLIDLETAYYLATTGTTGIAKLFAETRVGALARQLSIDIWNMSLSGLVPLMRDPQVKMFAVVNCAPFEDAPNGKKIQRASGQAGKVLWERAGQLYIFPYEFMEAQMSAADRDYLTAAYALKCAGFNMLFCHNLFYFGVLLDIIEERPQQLIDDIRSGHMTVELRDADREILSASFAPDADRADALQALFDKYGYLPFAEVWPHLSFIGTWLSGSAGRLAKNVRRRLSGSIRYLSEGYGASEAMLTIPMEFDALSGPLAPYAYYYEFLPVGGGQPVPMSDVRDGEHYELVITTYSGLYRYNLKDIVCVCGFTGSTANIEFCCKSTERLRLGGKDFYGYELMELLDKIEEKLGNPIAFYQGFADGDALSVAIQPCSGGLDKKGYTDCLREELAAKGISFGKLHVLKDKACNELFQVLMAGGKSMHSVKLPFIINAPPSADLLVEIFAE